MSAINKPSLEKKFRITVRLNEDHEQRVRQVAAVAGQTINSLAVSHLVKRANEIIEGGKPQSLL